jgi:hypothetical protein
MEPQHTQADLIREFHRERSIRRTMSLLDEKRRRILDDLRFFATSLDLMVLPSNHSPQSCEQSQAILKEALARLGDQAFAQWLLEGLSSEKH